MNAIEGCWLKNKSLGRYDLRYNTFTDEGTYFSNLSFSLGITRMTKILEEATHVFEVEIPERIEKETLEALKERLTANKPKKGKKGKKGKKKKK